eukprot:ANDGO_02390.mRNA.1 ATP-dependent RNA helicase ddx24
MVNLRVLLGKRARKDAPVLNKAKKARTQLKRVELEDEDGIVDLNDEMADYGDFNEDDLALMEDEELGLLEGDERIDEDLGAVDDGEEFEEEEGGNEDEDEGEDGQDKKSRKKLSKQDRLAQLEFEHGDFVEMNDDEFEQSLRLAESTQQTESEWKNFVSSGMLKRLSNGLASLVSFEEIKPPEAAADEADSSAKKKPRKLDPDYLYVKKHLDLPMPVEKLAHALPNWLPFALDPRILAALHKLKFESPTRIQSAVLPVALFSPQPGICGVAQTGSGKTLAFAIPIVQKILASWSADRVRKLRAIMVAPTRELAIQISAHVNALLEFTPIQCVSLVGGISKAKQERLLSRRPEILVTTPGRLWDFMSQFHSIPLVAPAAPSSSANATDQSVFSSFEKSLNGDDIAVRHICDVSELEGVVFDEADQMLTTGKYPELKNIWEYLASHQPERGRKRSIYLFSATLAVAAMKENKYHRKERGRDHQDKSIWEVFGEILGTDFSRRQFWKTIDVTFLPGNHPSGGGGGGTTTASSSSSSSPPADQLHRTLSEKMTHHYIECIPEEKDATLVQFLTQFKSRVTMLVFVNAIDSAKRVFRVLQSLNIFESVGVIHSKMQQRQRLTYLERFSKAQALPTSKAAIPARILVATDVAARGLDIPVVDVVVHFHVPHNVDSFIHRSGRCGRISSQTVGQVYSFIAPQEHRAFIAHVEQIFGDSWRSKVQKKSRESLFTSRDQTGYLREVMRLAKMLEKKGFQEWKHAREDRIATRMETGLREDAAELDGVDEDGEQVTSKKKLSKRERAIEAAEKAVMSTAVQKWLTSGSDLLRPRGLSRKFVTIHPDLLKL